MWGVCARGVREDFAYSVVYTRKQISEKKMKNFFPIEIRLLSRIVESFKFDYLTVNIYFNDFFI